MARYIEAEALKKVMCEGCDNKHLCTESPACETVQQIDAQPTADVEPVKHGHWIVLHGVLAGDDIYGDMGECSNCGLHLRNWEWDYCPNCGAKMDE